MSTAPLTEPAGAAPTKGPSTGLAAVRDLRATRKRHRLGQLEWFEAAYKVYLVGLFGGGVVLWLSDAVGDHPASAAGAADVARYAPAGLGLVAVLAVVMGLRAGSQGGPIALEAADVVHVMLAPVDRRQALLKPAVQRIRSAVFAAAMTGGVLGQLAGRRLPGSPVAWFASGMLFGAVVAMLWAGTALVAHVVRLPLWTTSIVAAAGFAWQGVALGRHLPGPANTVGDLALWGWRQHPVDLVPVVLAVTLVALGLVGLARLSLDALARRSNLVAQLRFAVTMQDLRTVVLLRRQLTFERTRRRPWIRLRGRGGRAVWRRDWFSLMRLPASRLLRMVALAAGAGACQAVAFRGTTPAVLGTLVLTFVLGLEALEPLSQEIDQPDWCDSYPVDRGGLLLRHLAAPFAFLVPFAAIGAVTAALVESDGHGDRSGAFVVAAILALPTLFAGAAGAAVSIVRDAPDPFSSTKQDQFMPPEMAGFTTVLRTLIPLVVSAIGALNILIVRAAVRHDGPDAALSTSIRTALAGLLVVAGVAYWVKVRDRIRAAIRGFMAEGRAQYQQQQRSTR